MGLFNKRHIHTQVCEVTPDELKEILSKVGAKVPPELQRALDGQDDDEGMSSRDKFAGHLIFERDEALMQSAKTATILANMLHKTSVSLTEAEEQIDHLENHVAHLREAVRDAERERERAKGRMNAAIADRNIYQQQLRTANKMLENAGIKLEPQTDCETAQDAATTADPNSNG